MLSKRKNSIKTQGKRDKIKNPLVWLDVDVPYQSAQNPAFSGFLLFDIALHNVHRRITIELFKDIAPKTAENFRSLIT